MLKKEFEECLGAELFKDAHTNFKLYIDADEVEELEHPISIEGLLLSLGVELSEPPKKLSLELFLTILKQSVEDADPLDGICVELADKFDHDYTGECTYK